MAPNQTKSKLDELDKQRGVLQANSNKWMLAYILLPLLVTAIVGFSMAQLSPVILLVGIFSGLLSYGVYYYNYTSPFNVLKTEVRKSLLSEFMSIYHPDIEYNYSPVKKHVYNIIKNSDLISADIFEEEDVIQGKMKNIDFYLSEIHLLDKGSEDESDTTVFKGLLFEIKLKNKSFPTSRIVSRRGIMASLFGSYKKNEEFGFYYDTNDQAKFNQEMESLFPFIRHLSKSKGDIKIALHKNSITLMIESGMKFLDDPKPTLHKSFHDEQYYKNMAKQLNSLLFIIESFADELSPIEIEEKLKLRVLEYADKRSFE